MTSDPQPSRPTGVGLDNAAFVRPLGSAVDGPFEVAVTPTSSAPVPGWRHTTLRVARLGPGECVELDLGDEECLVVPLSGGALTVRVVEASGVEHVAELAGRASVFAGACDVVFAGRGSVVTVTNRYAGESRLALAGGAARRRDEPAAYRIIRREEVPVELRGAGIASREVRGFGLPGVLDADSILVCEVVTPAGNWSSWPPHKHDTFRAGLESELEEIYYFETAPAAGAPGTGVGGAALDPVGYQRVYGSSERPIDVLAEVRTGDVVLVPHGWHGPAVAAPDADLYYLNVMAGPGPDRAWLICDDPAHAWVRDGWADLPVDPRLTSGPPA